jgi:hypothetical protein
MLGVAIAAMLTELHCSNISAPLKYILEFNPEVPLRFTSGYKHATPPVLNTCHYRIMPHFFGATSTYVRFAQLFNIQVLYFAFHSSFQRPTP